MLFGMGLHGLFSMPSAMNYVAPRGVSVMCRDLLPLYAPEFG